MGAVVAAGGCASAPEGGDTATSRADVFGQVLDDAVARGASDAQVQILRDARDAGELTLDNVKEAVGNTFKCFEEAGLSHSEIDVITQEGLARVSYSFSGVPGASEDQSLAVADACQNANSQFVELLYISQPASREVTDRFFTDNVRDRLIECLLSMKVAIDDQATNDELWQVASNLAIEIGAPYASGELPGQPTDCVSTLVGNPNAWDS